ncbi:MAG: lipopolysaccharide biosynthesis protein [Geobacteraceae bacterium]
MTITGSKIVKSTIVLSLAKVILQSLAFLKILVLARILSPLDFGLMGIATIVISTIESVTITGVELNLVRRQERIAEYIDTAWTISIVRGAALALVLFYSSSLIADFFHSPESLALLRATGLVFIIRGFTNSHIVYFTKRLEIKKQLALNLTEILTDLIFSISLSLIFRNVWGLVCGYLAASFARTVASFLLHGDKPRVCFDLVKIKELSQFGKFVWGTNITVLIGNKIDSIVIGKLLDAGSLGMYQMALKLTEPISKEFGSVMAQVLFPAYSSMQDDRERLQGVYLRTVKMVFSIFLPFTLLFTIYSPHVVPLLLGDKWRATIPIIQLLIVAGLFRTVFSIDAWTYYAIGKPHYNFTISMARVSVLSITIFPLIYYFGIKGAAISVLAANAFLIVPVNIYGKREMLVGPFRYMKNILGPCAVAVLTIIPASMLTVHLSWFPWWLSGVFGTVVFLAVFALLERELCRELLVKLRA